MSKELTKPHKRLRVVVKQSKIALLDSSEGVMAADLACHYTADLFALGVSYGDIGFLLEAALGMDEDNQIVAGRKGYDLLKSGSARQRVKRLVDAGLLRSAGRGKYWVNPSFVWNRHGGVKKRKHVIKLWQLSG